MIKGSRPAKAWPAALFADMRLMGRSIQAIDRVLPENYNADELCSRLSYARLKQFNIWHQIFTPCQ